MEKVTLDRRIKISIPIDESLSVVQKERRTLEISMAVQYHWRGCVMVWRCFTGVSSVTVLKIEEKLNKEGLTNFTKIYNTLWVSEYWEKVYLLTRQRIRLPNSTESSTCKVVYFKDILFKAAF